MGNIIFYLILKLFSVEVLEEDVSECDVKIVYEGDKNLTKENIDLITKENPDIYCFNELLEFEED